VQNGAIPRNAARIGFVPSAYEKQAVKRSENIRNSLGLNYKSTTPPAGLSLRERKQPYYMLANATTFSVAAVGAIFQ
jgi:hypothetical protein